VKTKLRTVPYKSFEGTVEIEDNGHYRGKILYTKDLVTYTSKTLGGLQKEFQAAVDDYLNTRKQLGQGD
jgi:predicted HicB family RNase H-like nuclease